jgi:hypothetical protein
MAKKPSKFTISQPEYDEQVRFDVWISAREAGGSV